MSFTIRRVFLLALPFAFAVQAAEISPVIAPNVMVKTMVDEVLSMIKKTKDKNALHELAETKILPNFDFQAMTRHAVGRPWREATPEQRKALEDAFRSLLVSTYTTALSQSSSNNPTVEINPVRINADDTYVTVKTQVKESGRQPIMIDYSMSKTSAGWKIYDVVVENLSLVTNYQGSFSSEIKRSGIDGLIKALRDKNKQLAAS